MHCRFLELYDIIPHDTWHLNNFSSTFCVVTPEISLAMQKGIQNFALLSVAPRGEIYDFSVL